MTMYKNTGDIFHTNKPMELEDAAEHAALYTWSEGGGIESRISEVEDQVRQTARMMAKMLSVLSGHGFINPDEVLVILNSGSGSWVEHP